MKKLITILLATFLFIGCDPSTDSNVDPVKSKLKLEEGEKSFADTLKLVKDKANSDNGIDEASDLTFDFRTSYALCDEAVVADPSNLDAQLCAAVTRILSLLKDDNFITLRDSWFDFNDEFNLDNTTLNSNRFKISKFINESLKPAIDYSLARIAVIDTAANKDYVFLVTPEIHGEMEEDTYELDMTEIKLFNSLLMSVKAGIDVTEAYKLDISDYSLEGIKTALNKGSDFLTLKDAAKMGTALSQAKLAVNKALEGIDFLLTENDDQDNDIIRNNKNVDDIMNFKSNLLDIQKILDAPYELEHNGVTTLLNIERFFNAPAQDLKALIPNYTISVDGNELKLDMEAEGLVDLVFPDTTFGGLLDELSQDDLKLLLDMYQCSSTLACDSYDHCTDDFQCEWGAVCSNEDDSMCDTDYEHCSAENFCADGARCTVDADCGDWDHCSADNICEYGTRCTDNTDCSDYEYCSADNICEYNEDK